MIFLAHPLPKPQIVKFLFIEQFKQPSKRAIKGFPKGEAEIKLDKENLIRFPLRPSGESEDHTGGPRRFFAYFLTGEKV